MVKWEGRESARTAFNTAICMYWKDFEFLLLNLRDFLRKVWLNKVCWILQILGSGSGWQPVSLTEIVTTSAVKKAYRKATLYVHPDKLQQRGATIQQKYICEKVFDLLKVCINNLLSLGILTCFNVLLYVIDLSFTSFMNRRHGINLMPRRDNRTLWKAVAEWARLTYVGRQLVWVRW